MSTDSENEYYLGDAMKWFTMLLLEQARQRGLTDRQIGAKLGGRQKGHIHQLRTGKVGVGFDLWEEIARWMGRPPGELLDEAVSWWKKTGAQLRAEQLEAAAQSARRNADSARLSSLPPRAPALLDEVARGAAKRKRRGSTDKRRVSGKQGD